MNVLSAETIDKIQQLADDARRSTYLTRPGAPADEVVRVGPDGACEVEIISTPQRVQLLTPAAFVDHLTTLGKDDEAPVFYDENRIVAFLDDGGRERCFCDLKKTEVFAWLETGSAHEFDQAAFVRFLRIKLRGTMPDRTLIEAVRRLKFENGQVTKGALGHGKESWERSAVAEATSETGVLPEEVAINTSVWENFTVPVTIACAIEVFPATQKLKLTPYPLELRHAFDHSIATLKDLLPSQASYGRPLVDSLKVE